MCANTATDEEVLAQANSILAQLVNTSVQHVCSRHLMPRFNTLSLHDYRDLSEIFNNPTPGLIIPDYSTYGREQKINSILAQFSS